MRFSAKERYGIRAMIDLAQSTTDTPLSAKTIADRQGISIDYLEQIFSRLRRAGLLKSVRGAKGGFLLARPAEEISVWDIVNAIGETISPSPCTSATGDVTHCHRMGSCRARRLWEEIAEGIRALLEKTKLSAFLLPPDAQPFTFELPAADAEASDNPSA